MDPDHLLARFGLVLDLAPAADRTLTRPTGATIGFQ
jgi:hypothetical protein